MSTEIYKPLLKAKSHSLTNYYCPSCKEWLVTIPDEFVNKIKCPCKKCQGWEVRFDFSLYLLRVDKERYTKYANLTVERLKLS